MRLYTLITTIIAAGIFATGLAHTTYAQQVDYSVRPSRLDVMIKPGTSYRTQFRITNYGDPSVYRAQIRRAVVTGANGHFDVSPGADTPVTFTLVGNSSASVEPIFLKSNESMTLDATIDAHDGESGDYYYLLVLTPRPQTPTEGAMSAQVTPRIEVPIIVSLTTTGERDGHGALSIMSLKPEHSLRLPGINSLIVDSSRGIPLYLVASNTGTNYISPVGNISVRGGLTDYQEYPILKRNVYARSTRLLMTRVGQEYCDRRGTCSPASMILGGPVIGKYSISAAVDWGYDAPKTYKTITVIAIPMIHVAIAAVILGIIALILHFR